MPDGRFLRRTLASIALAQLAIACTYNLDAAPCSLPKVPSGTGAAQLVHEYRDLSGATEEIWRKDCIFADANFASPRLSASEEAVALVGIDSEAPYNEVHAFQVDTGGPLWRGVPLASGIASSTDAFVVATSFGRVSRVQGLTGVDDWSSMPFPPSPVASMHIEGEDVYLYSQREELVLLAAHTGHPKQVRPPPGAFPVFLIDGAVSYGDAFYAVDTLTGSRIWETAAGGPVQQSPLFFPEAIVLRAGEEQGKVIAIQRESGSTLWEAPEPAVTNIASDGASVYLVTRAGELQRIAIESGNLEVLGQFDPPPTLPSEVHGPSGGFYIALTPDTSHFFVHMGDSAQLFAFSLH